MGQNCKVVHWPVKPPYTIELFSVFREKACRVTRLFLIIEHPTTDPFTAQIKSSQTPKNCSQISGPFLSKCSFAPIKSCHVVVYQVLLEEINVLKSLTGKDGSRSKLDWKGNHHEIAAHVLRHEQRQHP
jgi:hypothetical protein